MLLGMGVGVGGGSWLERSAHREMMCNVATSLMEFNVGKHMYASALVYEHGVESDCIYALRSV